MKRQLTAFWLIPAKPERELFREIIRILAKQLKAPIFEPHLTLFATGIASNRAKQILKAIGAMPLQLSIRDVQCSAEFTRTLFVRFRPNAALHKFVGEMQERAGQRELKICEPHVSLCYKELPARAGQELASMIRLPLCHVLFDSMKAVRCASPTRTAAEVKAWRVIARKKLTG